jgi:NAD(P)H-quinone oxidoreductase subunit 5
MNDSGLQDILPWLVVVGPVLLLAMLAVPRATANANPVAMRRLGGVLAWIAFAAALAAAGGQMAWGPVDHRFLQMGPAQGFHFGLGIYFDSLSAVMLLLVSFLGGVVTRYAANYLDGDAGQGSFMKWMCVTIGSVLTLIVAGNLLLFAAAWIATSLSLHQLLTFYPERPAALLAARKKFIISRLGDACLIAAILLTWQAFRSVDFATIFAAADALRAAGGDAAAGVTGQITAISALLVLGALLKSAQFPFHSWLPEVMETPTPVSALLHAGIINAGGFLIVRMSHVITLAPGVLDLLAIVGAFTAIFASVVMLTQTSIKVSLAYSTVAQMGFMMLQCGLGAFAAAVLHIVAHSLYKAHAFLSSGSMVEIAKSSWVPAPRSRPHPFQLIAALGLALLLTVAIGLALGIDPAHKPGVVVLAAVLMMALTHLIWNSFGDHYTVPVALRGIGTAALVCLAFFGLQLGAEYVLQGALPAQHAARGAIDLTIMAGVILLFMAVLVFQTQLPYKAHSPAWQAVYVHAFNGLYINCYANKLVERFWPIHARRSA